MSVRHKDYKLGSELSDVRKQLAEFEDVVGEVRSASARASTSPVLQRRVRNFTRSLT